MADTRPRRYYIERKTQDGRFLHHRGPATIADTSRTIYYQGLSLRRPSSNMTGCIYGNYFDENSGDEFWVSGVKQRGSNRFPGFERHPVTENGKL